MLNDQDVQKLKEVFATREEIATKGDLMLLREGLKDMIEPLSTRSDFTELQTAVDSYAKKADTYFQEMLAMNSRINRLERWVQELAKKVNLELTS